MDTDKRGLWLMVPGCWLTASSQQLLFGGLCLWWVKNQATWSGVGAWNAPRPNPSASRPRTVRRADDRSRTESARGLHMSLLCDKVRFRTLQKIDADRLCAHNELCAFWAVWRPESAWKIQHRPQVPARYPVLACCISLCMWATYK